MDCNAVRDRLTTNAAAPSGPLSEHLSVCKTCSRYAARLQLARRHLRQHHVHVEPDAAFVARLITHLPGPTDLLGWAAWRLLPAALALVVLLSWWCLRATPDPMALLVEAPSEDILSWIIATPEAGS